MSRKEWLAWRKGKGPDNMTDKGTDNMTDNPYVWWVARDGSHGCCYRDDIIILREDDIKKEVKELIDLAAGTDDLERVWDLMSSQQEGKS